MNPTLILQVGGFIVVVGGIVWSAAYQRGKSETIENNLNVKVDQIAAAGAALHGNHAAQLNKLWDWKDSHEKDAANMRLELQKQLGKVEAGLAIHDGQFAQLMNSITKMEQSIGEKIDKLEIKIEELNKA